MCCPQAKEYQEDSENQKAYFKICGIHAGNQFFSGKASGDRSEMTKRILIAGCGDLGAAVGAALAKAGHQVTGLRRSHVDDASAGIACLAVDLTRPETLSALKEKFDLVLVIVTPSDRSAAGYRAIYLEGVGNLTSHLGGQGDIPPIIYVSSTRVYGQDSGEWVDEASETTPQDECGRILLAAEQQVLTCSDRNTVVRFSGIYGRGEGYLLKQLKSRQPIQHRPAFYTNRIHRDDCVGALLFLAGKRLAGETLASCYLVSDDEPAPKWDVLSWLAGHKGLEPPPRQILDDSAPQGKRCSNRLIKKAGYRFNYSSFREGYASFS
jgi:nucleoside-diphosphate-sugar epimerase